MLDIKFIRQNPDLVKEGCRKKQAKVDIGHILDLDKKNLDLLRRIESRRTLANKFSKVIGGGGVCAGPTVGAVREAKRLKDEIKKLEDDYKKIEEELNKLLLSIPNLPLAEVPEGKDENNNVVLKEVGKRPVFKFSPRSYLEIAEKLDWIDMKRAARVSGSRFGYLKKTAALLEFALTQFAFETLGKEGFIPVVPPVLIRPKAMRAMGYLDRGGEEIYYLEKDDLYLVGTSEQSIGPMHMDEIFEEKNLPRRYVGFSTCFRREAGSYGKDTAGILRVHQFDKTEMFSFCRPEDARKEHQFLLKMEEKLMQALKIPYRVLNICAGDLGDSAAAKYDIEAWLPGENNYRETHSTSNCADFQARRLNIKFRRGKTLEYVHTLNGTAFSQRPILAIIENYQQKDGSVAIPQVLRKYIHS